METRNQSNSSNNREELIKEHLPLVRRTVSNMRGARFQTGATDFEDLVSYGTIGLIQAVDRYDARQGVPFAAFAVVRIRGAVLDAMRATDPLGRANRKVARQIEQTVDALSMKLERTPTADEVQAASGIQAETYSNTCAASNMSVVPLDNTTGEGKNWSDHIADDSEPFSAAVERRELVQALAVAVRSLPERERMVLSLYYVEGLKVVEIAQVLDLSQTRISQLMHRAYGRLRVHQQLADAAAA